MTSIVPEGPEDLKAFDKEYYKFWKEKMTGCCKDCESYIAYLWSRDDSSSDDMTCDDNDCKCVKAGRLCSHSEDKGNDIEDVFCHNISEQRKIDFLL